MKKVLCAFSWLYNHLNRLVEPRLAHYLPSWVTPNRVTFFRTALMVPVLVLQTLQLTSAGLIVYNFAIFLDYVDGSLARGRNQMTQFGACADAMADKISLGIILIYDICYLLVLATMNEWVCSAFYWLTLTPFLLSSGAFLYLESRLAIIRYEDYIYNINNRESQRDLRASASGKVKMILQSIGVGLLIVSFPNLNDGIGGYLGAIVLLAAMPFAWASLRGKLQRR